MTGTSRGVRIQLTIAFMCAALVVYLVLLGRAAVLMISSGRAVAIALGGALLILPAIGLWAMIATLRAGLAHQKLARLAAEDGMDLDVSALPRTAVGAHRTRRGRRTFRHRPHRTGHRSARLASVVPAGPCLRLRGRSKPCTRSHEESRRTTRSLARIGAGEMVQGRSVCPDSTEEVRGCR